MKRLSTRQLKDISGGVHWIPNRHGGCSAPGSHALSTIANGNGGKIPTQISADGIVLLGAIIGGDIGMMFGPVGMVAGAMIGQITKLFALGIQKT